MLSWSTCLSLLMIKDLGKLWVIIFKLPPIILIGLYIISLLPIKESISLLKNSTFIIGQPKSLIWWGIIWKLRGKVRNQDPELRILTKVRKRLELFSSMECMVSSILICVDIMLWVIFFVFRTKRMFILKICTCDVIQFCKKLQ